MTARTGRTPLGLRLSIFFKKAAIYVFLGFGAFLVTFPFIWMVLTSFKNYAEAIATPPTLWPEALLVRLQTAMELFRQYPLVAITFIVWMTAGVFLSRNVLRTRVLTIPYLLIHIALFFLIGNSGFFGAERNLGYLWQSTLATLNIEIEPLFANYVEAWGYAPFANYFANSVLMSTATPLLILVTGIPAAYAFARLRFPAKNIIFTAFLATMMIPREVLIIPNFVTVSQLGWIDTFWALIVPWIVSVMSIFFLRQFFMSVPDDLYDAAFLDGCGHLRFLWYIALPLSRPALVSTSLFNFLSSWNALLWPLLVTNTPSMRPVMVGMAYFSDEFGMEVQLHNAAATFTSLPIILLFLLIQRQFIEGIARTGIK